MILNLQKKADTLTKSLSRLESKQPNCTKLFIFIFQSSFIDCISSKIVSLDQLWSAVQQKLLTGNRKLVFFKKANIFCWFIIQNCHYLLPCNCPKIYKWVGLPRVKNPILSILLFCRHKRWEMIQQILSRTLQLVRV